MIRKSFTAIMAVLLAFFVAGCGGEEAKKPDQPAVPATKAVEVYTALYAKGDATNIAEIGMTEAQAKQITDALENDIKKQLAMYPLSDDNIKVVAEGYLQHLRENTKIETSMKKDDAEHPVVAVKATTIDQNVSEEDLAQNEGLQAIIITMAAAEVEGHTVEDLKANEDFQLLAAECLGDFVGSIPFVERTMDVTCEIAKGEDGKTYWKPQNIEALAEFAQGK